VRCTQIHPMKKGGLDVQIQLNILGNFDLRADGRSISGLNRPSSKLRSILCYLILYRDRAVTQAELIEAFYENEDQSNPAGALKMQIMRIRNALAELTDGDLAPIISRRGCYQWNPAIDCWVDAEEFERLCIEAESVRLSSEEKRERYRKAVELYKGESLLENDDLMWCKFLSTRYYNRYIVAVEKYAELLSERGDHAAVEKLCEEAIQKDSTNEKLHILMIRALLRQNKYTQARNHYKNTVDMLYHTLGVRPSACHEQLYARSEDERKPEEVDLGVIMKSMRNPGGPRTAFLCGFEQFKSIYQLEVRRAMRTGDCLHVVLLTVLGSNGKMLPSKVNNLVVERVQQTIVRNLRQSDVVARYSGCQFIIMLPSANQEDSCMVMERILRIYHSSNPQNVIRLSYQVRELELL